MNKYVNRPCKGLLATSCTKSIMASSEGKVAGLFAEDVSSSAEGELPFYETASTVTLVPKVCVKPGVSAAVQEEEECVNECVDCLSGEESAARHFVLEGAADDNDSFVDNMSSFTAVGDAESEGCTFADALTRANFPVETLAKGVANTSRLRTCESSFFIFH